MKIKKASIFMATYNKEQYLPNVLTSINKQETTFPFEVCIVDDYSRVDPEPLIRKYLRPKIELKYKRLTQNVGGRFARNICLDMMDPEANIAIITSCDVIYCQPFLLEELCQNVSEGIFTMPEIITLEVPVDRIINTTQMRRILKQWDDGIYKDATVYSGSRKEHKEYYFFLGAIRTKDLVQTGYRENSCDPIMDAKIKELGFEVKYLDHLKAIHQHHEWIRHPCKAVDHCEHTRACKQRNIRKERSMRILFYRALPVLKSTMLMWTLAQEFILRGHEVYFDKPAIKDIPRGHIDWVLVSGPDSRAGVELARSIGARVHVHLEGVEPWKIDDATEWGYDKDYSEIKNYWINKYASWMSAAFLADSCSANGLRQIEIIQNRLFDGKKLPNCHSISYGIDARYALSIGSVQRENYMVTVSRVDPHKKIVLIAEALSLLKHRSLPPWVIVGSGDGKQTGALLDFVKKHGIKIIMTKCFGAAKWMYVKKAKIMLQGWSKLSPAEGLVCETPVLSFNHRDVVDKYSDSIWYAKNNDAESFAERLDKLLDTSEYVLQEHVKAGKKQLLKGELGVCTQEQLAKKYEDIFMGKAIPREG